jgi:hypothetical protein
MLQPDPNEIVGSASLHATLSNGCPTAGMPELHVAHIYRFGIALAQKAAVAGCGTSRAWPLLRLFQGVI